VPIVSRRSRLNNAAVSEALATQYAAHALPENWSKLGYEAFLTERRARMAAVIREAFEKL